MNKKENIDIPNLLAINKENVREVIEWFKKDDNYQKADRTQNFLFNKLEDGNDDVYDKIYIKTVFINATHSTQLRGRQISSVAQALQEFLSGNKKPFPKDIADFINEENKNGFCPYSFITKYFSNSQREVCNERNKDGFATDDDYPIYDNIVNDLLKYERKYYDFDNKHPEFADYNGWCKLLGEVKDYINQGIGDEQEQITFKQIDLFFWYLGRQITLIGREIHKAKNDELGKNFYFRNINSDKYNDKYKNIKPIQIEIEYMGKKVFELAGKGFVDDVLKFLTQAHQKN